MADCRDKMCQDCLYYRGHVSMEIGPEVEDTVLHDEPTGTCHYDPPHALHGWPEVTMYDWCGQWQAYSDDLRTYISEAEA